MFLLHQTADFTRQVILLIIREETQVLEYAYPITVGDNVWIGGGVQVSLGVTIGSNVVIGGGSVVVKDIPSYPRSRGNPCKPIRKITDEDMKTVLTKV